MRLITVLVGLVFTMVSCSPNAFLKKRITLAEKKFQDHIGFILYDPGTKKTLVEFNSEKYFTPASNTKIFTFYTALQILGDSVPALKFTVAHDSLIFWGTGDPSFLYSKVYSNGRVYDFFKSAPQRLFFSPVNFQTEHLGPGWAWDDYVYTYSSERTSFPLFGNFLEVMKDPNDHLIARPSFFGHYLAVGDSVPTEAKVIRDLDSNRITFFPGRKSSSARTWKLPFHSSSEVIMSLLADTLKKEVGVIRTPLPKQIQILNSIPSDTLYRIMMQDSDNFIAEQLLILCAGVVSDTLNPEVAIRYAKKNLLFDLPDDPVWVDGSGLSRYNLFTPRSIVRLWEKIYTKVPRERLFKLLAVGSQSGTLKNWYPADKPFIFGKSGSLSNNHTLSGYLITKKDKVLIFSFMNANFTVPSDEIRRMMQKILMTVRNEY